MSGGMADIVIEAVVNTERAKANLHGLVRTIDSGLKGVQNSASAAFKPIDSVLADIDSSLARNKKRFDMNALSVLFFGQAIQQAGLAIARFGTKAFNDVSHSVEGAVTQTDYLNSSMTYLGFVVGQALEPVLAFLVPIIDAISEWVSEHQGLTAAIVTSMIVIGGALALYGILKLGITGVMNAAKDAYGAFTSLSSALTGVKVPTALDQIKTLFAVGIVAGIVACLFWIFKLQETMGGWGEFGKSVIRGVLRVFMLLAAGVAGVAAEIGNAFQAAWNFVLDGLENMINKAVVYINKFINGINEVFGTSIGELGGVDFSGMKADVKDFGDSFIETYSDMMDAYFKFEQQYLAPEKGYASFGGMLPDYTKQAQAAVDAAITQPASQSTVVYNNNTVNINADTTAGMEQVKAALIASGVSI
jgi:hypothetical protein